MRRLLLLVCLALSVLGSAQTPDTWEQVWMEVMTADDADDAEETLEALGDLAAHPLDVNRASREELEQLPFLSAQQVMDLLEYRDRYGSLLSLTELRMVRSLDYQQLRLLPFFVYVGPEPTDDRDTLPSLSHLLRYGKNEVETFARVPFYERKGDKNGYLGYKYKHWLRYEYSYRQQLKMGFVGAQDAGEPFFGSHNRWGYDYWSFYVQLRDVGRVRSLVVGRYKLSTGMGLVLNNSFSLGKLATLQSWGRNTQTVRAHTSRSEADYFQGAALTMALSRRLSATVYGSYRPLDATLDANGAARTLLTSGYHRTETELQKKHNTHQTATGLHVGYAHNGWRLGATAAYTHQDPPLEPDRRVLYRQHYAHGRNFLNASIDYSLCRPRFSLCGETATDADGHVATLNALSLRLPGDLTLMALQRFYSYRYAALHAHAMSEGGRVQNESAAYVGLTWRPLAHVQLQAYTDWTYFPWARYQVSQSSYARDHLLHLVWQRGLWTVQGRYRLHCRQRDNNDKTALVWRNEHRARLSVAVADTIGPQARLQADAARTSFLGDRDLGLMLSLQLGYKARRWQSTAVVAWFDTDSYDSRLYLNEPPLPRSYAIASYYGNGLHASLLSHLNVGRSLRLSVRLAYTNYFDRHTIGSSYQQIAQSHATDLDVQLRWHF